jgi:hypothetical protein
MRPYNFSSLAEGDYQIEINDHNGKVVLPLNHAVSVAPVKVKIEALEAKKFQLVMVGQPAEGLQVDILDNNNKVVFSDFITAQSSFRKVYNLNQVQAENFKFEVRSQNRIITTEKF